MIRVSMYLMTFILWTCACLIVGYVLGAISGWGRKP